jgi:SAM-dependent methyltransferase
MTGAELRAALEQLPETARDAWWNEQLGLEAPPEDGPSLPRGCVPYFPCSVGTVLRVIESIGIGPDDVFVDVGSGLGRVTLLVALATGARAIGIEIQPELISAARELSSRFPEARVSYSEGDAAVAESVLSTGTVFFLYCPFSGERLEAFIDRLAAVARRRTIFVCTIGVATPERDWLVTLPNPSAELVIQKSVGAALDPVC